MKNKRSNWVKGGNIVIFIKAARDWDNNTGSDMKSNDENIWLGHFCIIVGIDLLNFENYVGPNLRELGKSVGHPSLLNPKDVTVIAEFPLLVLLFQQHISTKGSYLYGTRSACWDEQK